MKKSVLLVRNVNPKFYGGGEIYQIKVAEELKKHNFEPFIVTSSSTLLEAASKQKINIIHAPFIETQNWSGWRNLLFPAYCIKIMRLRRWYKKIFREYQPQVVNIQSRDDWIAATKVAKRMGIKVLWTDHMDMRSWVLQNVNIWYKNLIGKWVLKCAKKVDKIIMISDFERKYLDDLLFEKMKNVVTIKNGVEDELEEHKNIKAVKDTFCYVGRIVDYKGISELIEAFGIISKKYNGAKLNIYGDGDINYYEKIMGDRKDIIFHGLTDDPLKVLAENEIFVLPSYREGLSLSLLEAAMMGKKIIASNVDGNPEVVINERTGILVPAKNIEKLAEAMAWMLKNKKEACKMAKNARKLYEEKYNFEKIFNEKMLPLYNLEKE